MRIYSKHLPFGRSILPEITELEIITSALHNIELRKFTINHHELFICLPSVFGKFSMNRGIKVDEGVSACV